MIFTNSIFIESSFKYYRKISYGESDINNRIHLKKSNLNSVVTIADKDTFVYSLHADVNYGDSSFLLVGIKHYWVTYEILESYFHFPFDLKPKNWVKAEISLYIGYVSSTMNLSYCIIEEPWDEYTTTFRNRPSKGVEITQLVVIQDGVYKVDVSNFIKLRTSISICVYIHFDNLVLDYVNITSREGFISQIYAPKLIWTYETDVSKPKIILGYNLSVFFDILSFLSIIITIKIKKN